MGIWEAFDALLGLELGRVENATVGVNAIERAHVQRDGSPDHICSRQSRRPSQAAFGFICLGLRNFNVDCDDDRVSTIARRDA